METLSYQTKTKARKEHRCNFCCQPIQKNTFYTKSTHKMDGIVYDWKTHSYCSEIASKLDMYDNSYDGLTTEDFIEYIKRSFEILNFDKLEDENFSIPDFPSQLLFVLNHYEIAL
jgi:hypothetical protein